MFIVTVTVNVPVATLPAASAAAHVTTVSPMANVLPDAGVQLTVGEAGTASDAVAVKVIALPAGEVASAVSAPGSVWIGRVVSRTELLEHVWDRNYEGSTNIVDVYVGYLRRKLERPFGRPVIHTVRGAGYVIEP